MRFDYTKGALLDQILELKKEKRQLEESIVTLNMIIQSTPRASQDSQAVQGLWIMKNKSSVYCDRCAYVVKEADKSPYCPRCGAKMN